MAYQSFSNVLLLERVGMQEKVHKTRLMVESGDSDVFRGKMRGADSGGCCAWKVAVLAHCFPF